MSEIADEVGIGEAPLYRYFQKKENIVILSACNNWKRILKKYFREDFKSKTTSLSGYEMVKYYFDMFVRIYQEDFGFLAFIYAFDSYVTSKQIGVEELEAYAQQFLDVKAIFDEVYDKGLIDGSIRNDVDPKIYYYSSTHALLGLCSKMASEAIVKTDKVVASCAQIQLLADMITKYIKKN